MAEKKGSGARVVIIIAAVLLVAIFAVAAWWCGFYGNIYPGVSVAGVDVGGMSLDDATVKLADALSGAQGTVTLSNGGETAASFDTADILSGDFDLQTEAENAAKYAYDSVREKGIGAKISAMFGGKTELPLENATDAHMLTMAIEKLCASSGREAVDGSWKVRSMSYGDTLEITAGSEGLSYDAAAMAAEVERRLIAGEFGDVDMAAYATVAEPKAVDLDAVYKELHVEPQDAQLIKNEETGEMDVLPEVIGYDFDLAAAKEKLAAGEEAVVVTLERKIPAVTEEQLRATMFEDLLAECFTTMENKRNYDRTGNVKLAAEAINGTILMPGEEFSYNDTVGERTVERGYKKASVYLSNGIEDQLGGGICQTSSTLYMAVIRARLEVTSRKPHKYSVGYTPLGEDATVYWGSLDFKFKNNREYPVKIVAWQEGYDITVQIWGTDVDGYKVEISHVTHSYTPYSTVEVENPELDYGKTRQKVQGHSAYSVTTYATVTDADGNQVDYYKVADSKYVLLNRVLEVGTKGAPASTSPEPSAIPAVEPTAPPSTEPTAQPTVTPTVEPTVQPTVEPTPAPTPTPTEAPFVPATSSEPTAPPPSEP